MNTTSEKIDHRRRHLLGASAAAAAAQLGMLPSANAKAFVEAIIDVAGA